MVLCALALPGLRRNRVDKTFACRFAYIWPRFPVSEPGLELQTHFLRLASDDFNLLRREVRRLIRSEVVAISEETRR